MKNKLYYKDLFEKKLELARRESEKFYYEHQIQKESELRKAKNKPEHK